MSFIYFLYIWLISGFVVGVRVALLSSKEELKDRDRRIKSKSPDNPFAHDNRFVILTIFTLCGAVSVASEFYKLNRFIKKKRGNDGE